MKDKPKTAMQAIEKPRLEDVVYDSGEWHRLTAKEKIEWVVMDAVVNFSKREKSAFGISDNIIRHGFDMYRAGGDFDEAMVAVIIAMKKSLDSLYSKELARVMLNPSPSLFIKD